MAALTGGAAGTPIFIFASSNDTGLFGDGSAGRGVPTATAFAGSTFVADDCVAAGRGGAIGDGAIGAAAHPVNPKLPNKQRPVNRIVRVIDRSRKGP